MVYTKKRLLQTLLHLPTIRKEKLNVKKNAQKSSKGYVGSTHAWVTPGLFGNSKQGCSVVYHYIRRLEGDSFPAWSVWSIILPLIMRHVFRLMIMFGARKARNCPNHTMFNTLW